MIFPPWPFAVRTCTCGGEWEVGEWEGSEWEGSQGNRNWTLKLNYFCFPRQGRAWQGGHLIDVVELSLQCVCWARPIKPRSLICCALGWPTSVLERNCVATECKHAVECACSAIWVCRPGADDEGKIWGREGEWCLKTALSALPSHQLLELTLPGRRASGENILDLWAQQMLPVLGLLLQPIGGPCWAQGGCWEAEDHSGALGGQPYRVFWLQWGSAPLWVRERQNKALSEVFSQNQAFARCEQVPGIWETGNRPEFWS